MGTKALDENQLIVSLKFIISQARYTEARELCEYILLRIKPDHEAYIQVRMMLLEIYMNLHENDQFITLFEAIKNDIEVRGEPIDRTKLSLLIAHYWMFNIKDHDKALPHYQQALSLALEFCHPDTISVAMNNIAVILFEKKVACSAILNFLEEHLVHFEKLNGINELTYIEAHVMYFRTLISMQQFEKVQSKIKYLLSYNVAPFVQLKLYYHLALCQYEGGQYEAALETCEKNLALLKENPSLNNLLYIYLEVYDIMRRAAKAIDSPSYALYEQQYKEILEKDQACIQQHLANIMNFYDALPYYEPNESFYRKMDHDIGTFFILNSNDIQPILTKISEHYPFIWTTFTNNYGVYIREELTEEELATLLMPMIKYENYTFCHFKSNKDTPKVCYLRMQATLYYREHLAMSMM